jgi:uncharacterized protein (UPF0179 family)
MITLIGKDLAKEGMEFQYLGPLLECKNCKLKNVCFNLDEGKWYRITKIRDKEHDCKVHDEGKVVTVEVEELPVPVVISAKSVVEGETISFKPVNCKEYDCEYYELCHPMGLREGTKIKIEKIEGEVNCPKNKDLKKVLVTW